jgi:hypothetical protein
MNWYIFSCLQCCTGSVFVGDGTNQKSDDTNIIIPQGNLIEGKATRRRVFIPDGVETVCC